MKKTQKLPPIGVNAPRSEGVNIIRKDYLSDKKVIFATARGKRPEQFTATIEKKTSKKDCPFCPQNQDKILIVQEDKIKKGTSDSDWRFRSVTNLFAITRPLGDVPSMIETKKLLNQMPAYGYAEVIIETPKHDQQLEDLPPGGISEWLSFLAERVRTLEQRPGVRYVSIFKNRGHIAGASISHAHTQIITTPHVPRQIQEHRRINEKYLTRNKRKAFTDIIDEERKGPRIIMETERVICFAPYASETPLEAWIVPRRTMSSMLRLTQEEKKDIEHVLRTLLTRLNTLGTPPYNLLFLNDTEYSQSQFHLRLHPRITSPRAGFELITGLSVNPTLPEEAASFYRGDAS